MRLKGYIAVGLLCCCYWVMDSIWSFVSFEQNLRTLIFSEPASYLDTFLLRVSPYQTVSRIMVVALLALLGTATLEFFIKRQSAGKKRQEAHDTLLTVLNSIDATIYVADMERHEILFMNQHMIDSFGGDFTGRTCYKAFRSSPVPCSHCTNDRLLDGAGNPTDVVAWEGRNPITGTWYLNYDRAIRWIDGRMVRLQIAADITRLKELQDQQIRSEIQLQRAQKMESIGTLAGGIAHDFNNILSTILGMSELLMDDLAPDRPDFENAREIFNAGRRGRDLVRQILTFSRQSDNERKPVRMQQELKEAIKIGRSTIPANIDIRWRIQDDCGVILADPTQLQQVVMNLLVNAYHAVETKEGAIFIDLKEITFESEEPSAGSLEPGRYALLSVSDTGCGIEPGLIGKVFEPYFTTKAPGKGTGLGLSVVYGIVRKFGGDVRIHSKADRGTSVDVYLPVMKRSADPAPVETEEKPQTGAERILLVDDEEPIVRLTRQMLEKLGYRISTRSSSLDALEAFRAAPDAYDLVITDMTMPDMTGDRLADELQTIRPDIPIIMSTGFSEKMSPEKANEMGIKGFLMKPVDKAELAKTVRKILDEAKGSIQDS